jgi:hypothetical protein
MIKKLIKIKKKLSALKGERIDKRKKFNLIYVPRFSKNSERSTSYC